MNTVTIEISIVREGRSCDAAEVAWWVGQVLSMDARDTTDSVVIHSLNVEGES